MTCQFYNPATRHPAGARSVKGRGTRNLAVCAAALLAALTTAPSAAQVWIGPVYGPPAACPAPACRPPVSCWGPPATFAQPGVPTLHSWPPTIDGGTPVTTFYPPATLEDAAPLLQQISGSVRVIIPEAFLNRLLARSDTDTGPVVDNILGANVTGSQNTNTMLSVDVTKSPQLARMQLQLTGTTQNQTIGVTPQAAVRSRGAHEFRLTKQVDFDGLTFSTRSPAAWVTPRLTNEGAATRLTGVPLLGPLSNQIALTEAERRRPAAEQVITRRLTDQVAPRFNHEVDQQLSDANVRLQRHIPSLLGAAGLTPADVSLSSTDQHVLFGLRVPLVQTSRRAAPEAVVPENPVTEETDPLLATQLGPPLPTPLATDVPPAAQPNEPRPPAAEKTNRPPVLLAPIEPADPPAPADPKPATGGANEQGEYTVIRQISDVLSGTQQEPAANAPTGTLVLPQLRLESQPSDITPVPVVPSGDATQIMPATVAPTGVPQQGELDPPPSFTAGASLTVAVHETAINYALHRAPLGGARVPDRTIDRLLEQLVALLAGTPPTELALEGLGSEQPEFATIVLRSEDPLSVRFADGQVVIEAVAAFEPLLTPAVPLQRVRIPFSLNREEDRLMLVPGEVTVEALPGQEGGPLVELARPIIRQQVTQRLKPIELPTSLPFNLPGQPPLCLTTREATLAGGWLLIAVD